MTEYQDLSDIELTKLLKESNRHAFTELFNRFGPVLFKFTHRKLKDKELTQDMLQTVFADLWEKRETLNIQTEFIAYLFTIIKNRIFNHYKHQQVSQRYLDQFQTYINNADDYTDHLIRHNDLSALIEKEIAALPEKMRVVFELSRNTNLSRKEIADELKLSEEAVKARMTRALRILKKRLGGLLMLV